MAKRKEDRNNKFVTKKQVIITTVSLFVLFVFIASMVASVTIRDAEELRDPDVVCVVNSTESKNLTNGVMNCERYICATSKETVYYMSMCEADVIWDEKRESS